MAYYTHNTCFTLLPAGFYSGAPDDRTFRYLASTYARSHRTMGQNIRCCCQAPGHSAPWLLTRLAEPPGS